MNYTIIRIFFQPLDLLNPNATTIGLAIMYFLKINEYLSSAKLKRHIPKWFPAKFEVLIVDGSHLNKKTSKFLKPSHVTNPKSS